MVKLAFLLLLAQPLCAQYATRQEELREAQRKKAQQLQPEVVPDLERQLNFVSDNKIIERIFGGFNGLHVKVGGLRTGQGFAVGPQYTRLDLAGGDVHLRASARGSAARAYRADLQVTFPDIWQGRAFVDLLAAHENSPRIDYYGPGPDSSREARSNFLLEDSTLTATFGVRPAPWLTLGAAGGYLWVNTGPGSNDDVALTEDVFGPEQIPGLARQTNFALAGGFLSLDTRDTPGGPRSGSMLSARLTHYQDQELEQHSFRRLQLEGQHYFPFFNKRRVIALRAHSSLSFRDRNQTVPFYLQPVLGGSRDLRGFRPYRFRDDNLLVLNAEYRWEAFAGLDMAAFFDAGKVAPRRAGIDLADLEKAYGFGLRFNARNSVFMRIDFGFGREGFQPFFKFENVF